MTRAGLRKAESLAEIDVLREEIAAWRDRWDDDPAVDAHRTQLARLAGVLGALTADIDAWARAEFDRAAGTGAAYEVGRKADELALHVRRLWRWYADKLDLLGGAPADPAVRTVRAADEVIWSCWKTAWTRLAEGGPPAAPIPYLEARFTASAMPCDSAPRGIKPGDGDELLRRHIDLLPIPVIALPPACTRRPWWLIVAAHEAGHLFQAEARLTAATAARVEAAALDPCDADAGNEAGDADGAGEEGDELADRWGTWAREVFADAFAVLLTGPAAIWAIAELEMRADLGHVPEGVSLYPPPLVRVAVANEVARQAGLPGYDPGFPPTPATRDKRLGRLMNAAPAVAGAILGLTGPSGRELKSLGTEAANAFLPDKRIEVWRDALLGDGPPRTEHGLSAARFCASAGVAAWQRIAAELSDTELRDTELRDTELRDTELRDRAARLAARLLRALPDCGEAGERGGRVTPATRQANHDLARRIAADLYRNIGA